MSKKPAQKDPLTHFVAGGAAGLAESTICHPLDTIKTRMQLRGGGREYKGPFKTGMGIVQKDGPLALYKGLTAVQTGIVPKMAIRFWSFEMYKKLLGQKDGQPLGHSLTFLAGLGSGVTEAVLIVTPFEVCKIRLQGQFNSMSDPEDPSTRKYRNVAQTAYTVAKEEGVGALWKGVGPTLMRQGINQAVNFTAYQAFKAKWTEIRGGKELFAWQHFLCGGVSGALGPIANCPLDVVKTRLQKQVIIPGQVPKYTGMVQAVSLIAREEGVISLWKGLEPRLMRIVPGQAITFMIFEKVAAWLATVRT
eukprot:c11929_g1_i1.p1 GENE.c11929_g1_i1~~c11929_g1_i1.p1  ORF type:complete len:306 (+),score=49.81 c11929_g1_i1:136-1053(+)